MNNKLASDIMLMIAFVRLQFPVMIDHCANDMLHSTRDALDKFGLEDTWTIEELEKKMLNQILMSFCHLLRVAQNQLLVTEGTYAKRGSFPAPIQNRNKHYIA